MSETAMPMRCTSCQMMVDITEITRRPSKLIKDMHIYMCNMCEDRGLEPRHIVVIAARLKESRATHYIKNELYIGNAILASEIV